MAVPLVQWFSLEIVLLNLNGILSAVQNALGYPGDRLGVAVGTGLLRWVFGYVGVRCFGLVGVGMAMCLVSSLELSLSLVLVGTGTPTAGSWWWTRLAGSWRRA